MTNFANAIARQEGYGVAGAKATRTSNPGNIGNTDDGSTVNYGNPDAGYAALDNYLANAASGNNSHGYTGATTIAQFGQKYASDPAWASGVAKIMGVPVTSTLDQIANGVVKTKDLSRVMAQGDGQSSSSTGDPLTTAPINDADPAAAVAVYGSTIASSDLAAVQQYQDPTVVTSDGLNVTPWFSNKDMVQVNGPTKNIPEPISFRIFQSPGGNVLPIQIKLNASLQSEEREMQHVVNEEFTRTGLLLTLWGSNADVISGRATTGLFMNRTGVSDFLSMSNPDSAVVAEVQAVLANLKTPTDSFRIAAKDAFMEFLAMFKNNGVVWYQGKSDATYSAARTTQDAWSTVTGSSTFMNMSRNNDVVTRGTVAMQLRNTTHYGYFKSLSMQMDAEKPFRWDFNFVFQVEHTTTFIPVPA